MIILFCILILLGISHTIVGGYKDEDYENNKTDSWGEDFDEKKYNKKVKSLQIEKEDNNSSFSIIKIIFKIIAFIILTPIIFCAFIINTLTGLIILILLIAILCI